MGIRTARIASDTGAAESRIPRPCSDWLWPETGIDFDFHAPFEPAEKGDGWYSMRRVDTLKKNYEFRRLYQRGKSAAGGCMVIYCRANRLGRSRLGLTASVKIGGAVQRNRARRRLREVFRLGQSRLKSGYDIILVARARTLSAPWTELNAVFFRLCGKLDILINTPEEKNPARESKSAPGEKNPAWESKDGGNLS